MTNSQKYMWLYDQLTSSAGGLTLQELSVRWSRSVYGDGEGLPKRTFRDWVNHVERLFDVNIRCDRNVTNRYSVDPTTINREQVNYRKWVFNTLSEADVLSKCSSLKGRIMYEDVFSSPELLTRITDAMKQERTLMMTYDGYADDKKYTKEVQPHALKRFKQRWYVVVITVPEGNHRSYALDRIIRLEMTDNKYKFDKGFDVKAAFHNSYGMYSTEGQAPVDIRLRLNQQGRNYLRSLPLHHSQKETETHEDYSVFSLRLCPSFDFVQALLDFEDQLEVLEPAALRDEMKQVIRNMADIYRLP